MHVIQMCGGLGIQMRKRSDFPPMTLPELVRGWQSTWFYCRDIAPPGQSTGLPPFSLDHAQQPSSLRVTAAERVETNMLVERLVQLVRQGVTGMDLLEVFLSRRIQPLQARDHSMWMYSGANDTARVHPEEVTYETVALCLTGITGNKDNPRGVRRVDPFDTNNQPDKVYTKMYSMPNGEQALEQDQEGEDSTEESSEWESPEDDDEEDNDESDDEEVVDSPPRSEHCSKQLQDPAGWHGKTVAPSTQAQKRTRTSTPEPTEKVAKQPKVAPSKPQKTLPKIKMDVPVTSGAATSTTSMDVDKVRGDEEADDATTSKAAPRDVIELPADEEEVPLRKRRRRGRASILGNVVISKKNPTHTQYHGDDIATRGESVVHVPL